MAQRGRPRVLGDDVKQVAFMAPLDMRLALKAIAEENGRSIADVVRFIVHNFLIEYNDLDG